MTRSAHRATIADVATTAGVSVGTVSRVLNDSPNVREYTRLRVSDAYSNESIAQGDVVVSTTGQNGKEVYKYISGQDLLVITTDQTTGNQTVAGNQAEQQIDTALDYVTSTNHPTILFTTGHGEQDSTAFQSLLKTGNYNVR